MWQSPLIIGHRGASAVAPENTIAAFREAIAAGADGIEFDVRLTRDGVPVIIHDNSLYRTARLPHRIADLTRSELEQIEPWSSCVPKPIAAAAVGISAMCSTMGRRRPGSAGA